LPEKKAPKKALWQGGYKLRRKAKKQKGRDKALKGCGEVGGWACGD
jgi:hypothetical protein